MPLPTFSLTFSSPFLDLEAPTVAEIEELLDGNLCRCTGYRPVLDALKPLGSDFDLKELGPMNKGIVTDKNAVRLLFYISTPLPPPPPPPSPFF